MKIKLFFGLILVSTIALTQIPTNGLIAYYPLDGDANDISSNANHGTIAGAQIDTGYTNLPGTSYNFENGHIDLNSMITFPDSNLTLTCWVKMNYEENHDKRNQILSLSKNATYVSGDFDFYIENHSYCDCPPGIITYYHFPNCVVDTKNQGTHQGTYEQFEDWNFSIHANQWSFVTMQITPDSIHYSINDKYYQRDLTYSKVMGGAQYNSGIIGKDFNGSIDELRIYDRRLSKEEITAIHSGSPTSSIGRLSNEIKATIFPNPVSDNLTISIDDKFVSSEVLLKIVDVNGLQVYSEVMTSSSQSIDVSSWSAGIYFLHVMDGTTDVETRKIVVNN